MAQTRIELTEEARKTLEASREWPERMLKAIASTMDRENLITIAHIQREYLSFSKSGPPVEIGLRVQSGRLIQALSASKAVVSGQSVGSGIGDSVKYAAIHEFGGRIPAHTILPKSGKALRFQIGERVIFATKVEHPGSEMPARRPVQRGIEDRLDEYGEEMSEAIVTAMKS